MSKYTRGPWKFHNIDGCKRIRGAKAGSHKQAQYKDIAFTVGLFDDAEDLANARLIAAAPEMYEMLKMQADIMWFEGAKSASKKITDLLNRIDNG